MPLASLPAAVAAAAAELEMWLLLPAVLPAAAVQRRTRWLHILGKKQQQQQQQQLGLLMRLVLHGLLPAACCISAADCVFAPALLHNAGICHVVLRQAEFDAAHNATAHQHCCNCSSNQQTAAPAARSSSAAASCFHSPAPLLLDMCKLMLPCR
jgi:hypothetical protein